MRLSLAFLFLELAQPLHLSGYQNRLDVRLPVWGRANDETPSRWGIRWTLMPSDSINVQTALRSRYVWKSSLGGELPRLTCESSTSRGRPRDPQ